MKSILSLLLLGAILVVPSRIVCADETSPESATLSVEPQGVPAEPVPASATPKTETLQSEVNNATESNEISDEPSAMEGAYESTKDYLVDSVKHDKILWSLVGVILSAIGTYKFKKGISSIHTKGVELTSQNEMLTTYIIGAGIILLFNGIACGTGWSFLTTNLCTIGVLGVLFGISFAAEACAKRKRSLEEAAAKAKLAK